MSSSSAGNASGANSNQDGLSNMRMIVANILKWGPVTVAVIIAIVWIKSSPWAGMTSIQNVTQNARYTTTTTASPLEAQCDYSHKRLELGSEPVAFNPGARCAYRFTVKEGAVEFDGPDGKTMVEPNTLVDMHSWDETVRAVNGHAVFLYQLYPAAG